MRRIRIKMIAEKNEEDEERMVERNEKDKNKEENG